MSLNLKSSETASYQSDPMAIAQGITFHLPSRRQFIPYSWLLYAEMNQAETELYLQYNHSVVTITGTELRVLHEAMEHFHLHTVRECPSSGSSWKSATVSRIEIAEKVSD
jgi:predicted NACHT family NTPase